MTFRKSLGEVTIGQWTAVFWFTIGLLMTIKGEGAVHYWGLVILLTPLWWQTYFIIKPRMVVRNW